MHKVRSGWRLGWPALMLVAVVATPILTATPAQAWWRHPGWRHWGPGPVWHGYYGPGWRAGWGYGPRFWGPRVVVPPPIVISPPYVVVR